MIGSRNDFAQHSRIPVRVDVKFHIGQKVRVVKVGKDGDLRHVGQCGKVMTATSYGYKVLLDTWDEEAIFFQDELEPT